LRFGEALHALVQSAQTDEAYEHSPGENSQSNFEIARHYG
jgi:hypothetical protein